MEAGSSADGTGIEASPYRRSGDLPDTVLDLMPLGLFVCDARGVLIRYNRRAAEFWGRTPALGERYDTAGLASYLDGRPLAHRGGPMATALRSGASGSGEAIFERPGGSRVTARFNIAPYRDADGRVDGAVVTLEDITDRRRDAVLQTEGEARLRTVLDRWVDGTFMLQAVRDEGGSIVDFRYDYANPAALRYKRAVAQELIGQGLQDYMPAERAGAFLARFRRVVETGESDDIEIAFEAQGVRGWLRSMAVKLDDGVVVSFRDISEQKRLEESLRASKDHFRKLAEATVEGVAIHNGQVILDCNESGARMFGYDGPQEVIGSPLSDFLAPESFGAVRAKLLAGQEDLDEAVGRRKDGSTFPVEYVGKNTIRHGQVVRIVVIRDITRRKRIEAQQRLLLHELDHRIKNILATVQALALQTYATTPRDESFLDRFGARLRALGATHELLTRESWKSATLRDVVGQQLVPYGAATEDRVRLTGPAVHLPSDTAVGLGLVIHELTTNAAKYGALSVPAGRVEITWRVDAGARLHLEWREAGGPPVKAPERQGFGSMLIESAIADSLNGTIRLDYQPEGMLCVLELPLDGTASGSA